MDRKTFIYEPVALVPPPRRLPLAALRSFEAAARHLSFKNAAAELCVSATTVSNQIRDLEREWRCKLFHRKTRAVVLTERGRSLALVLTRAFDDIRSEVEQNLAPVRKTVTIAVGPIFGSRWLAPRLSQFNHDHPDMELIARHGERFASGSQLATDIAIDWRTGDPDNLEAVKLVEARYSPIVSRELLSRLGGLSDPSDLSKLLIIHQHDRSEWRNWFEFAGYPAQELPSEIVVHDSNVVQSAVKEGQGAALGVFPFQDEDVRSGQLVKPFDIDLLPSRAYYLVTHRQARKKKEVRAVCEWIEAQAQ